MNNKKYFKEVSIEDALATSLNLLNQGQCSTEDCLRRFPSHRVELEQLLKKYIIIHSHPKLSPHSEFSRLGYQQIIDHSNNSQSVTFQPSFRNIRYKPVRKLKWRFSMVQILIIVMLALTALTGGAVYASDGAEPGDMLYGLDRAIEQLRLIIASDSESAAQLHLGFAVERLEEALSRLSDNDFENANIALNFYGEEISSLAKLVGSAGGVDQEALAELVNAALAIHQDVLTNLLNIVPEQALEGIQNAINVSIKEFDFSFGPPEGTGPPEDPGLPESAALPESAGLPEGTGSPENAGPPEDVGALGNAIGLTLKDCFANISKEDAQALVEMAATYGVKYEEILRVFCVVGSLEKVEELIPKGFDILPGGGPPIDVPGGGRP